MCATRFTEPRLHTAISSSEVLRVISVHRLELCTTPACCCGLLRLHGSLNVIQGCPVSKSIESILRHSCTAGIFLKSLSSPRAALSSKRRYASSKALPNLSCSSRVSEGENNVHSAFSMTRFMNRSGIQLAVFMSWVRRRSSPVFFLSSRNSSISRCQVSRYEQAAPLRLPPWFTATAVSFTTLRKGTTPCDLPLVPLMCEPSARTGVQSLPSPPAYLASSAFSLIAS